MTESDRRRLISSTPHLTPDEIVQRAFTTSFRGYSEAEVRAFLKRVSEEIVAAQDREAELKGVIDTLEEQLRSPRPLNEPEMLEALGAETTRLLQSARETADEIRTKAEARATQLVEDAQAEAARIAAETDELARTRNEEIEARAAALETEAEARAAEALAETETYSEAQHQRAEHEAEEIIEAARRQGRDMLDEAKVARERVLADLARRRSLLQAQIEALRAGRDSLLDAYRVVKRSFLEATGALSQVEARAAAEREAHEHDGDGTVEVLDATEAIAAIEPESEATVAESLAEGTEDTEAETSGEGARKAPEEESGEAAADEEASGEEAGLADVESLFARIRAGAEEATPEAPAAEAPESDASDSDAATSETAETVETPEPGTPDTESEAAEIETGAPDQRQVWRAQRAEVLDPLLVVVAKRAKRAAQDDQNALLDAVRRHKGRPTSAQVLVPEPDLLAAWSAVVHEALGEAYGAGRLAAGGAAAPADDELVLEAAATIVLPLRERISSAIDSGEEGDTSGLVERIGARFREWKNQSLEDSLVDALSMAWSRGVYDASPEGAVLRWVPDVEGRCADCDDNGLEPTLKGSTFPTGQLHPPAHLGCRCLLAPSDT
jgi:DivIVA domain-containing protein